MSLVLLPVVRHRPFLIGSRTRCFGHSHCSASQRPAPAGPLAACCGPLCGPAPLRSQIGAGTQRLRLGRATAWNLNRLPAPSRLRPRLGPGDLYGASRAARTDPAGTRPRAQVETAGLAPCLQPKANGRRRRGRPCSPTSSCTLEFRPAQSTSPSRLPALLRAGSKRFSISCSAAGAWRLSAAAARRADDPHPPIHPPIMIPPSRLDKSRTARTPAGPHQTSSRRPALRDKPGKKRWTFMKARHGRTWHPARA